MEVSSFVILYWDEDISPFFENTFSEILDVFRDFRILDDFLGVCTRFLD